ncbi:MAG: hypothetical protein AABX13_02980 [Nanoarchaeota archaeon]
MEKEIYHGACPGLLKELEEAILVSSYRVPAATAEGMEISIYHLGGVTVKQEVEEDVGHTVSPFGPSDLSDHRKMRISLYSAQEAALGEIERRILQEIRKKKK